MSIARITPIVGSLYGLMRTALGLNVETPLGAQELSCTVAPDRRLVVLGHEPIAGFARDHGTVADEAAMLALHTLDSATLLTEPTFVAPGDSCLRADDPGWRWHCISGHGTQLSDWERRPLAATVVAAARSAAFSDLTGSPGDNAALAAILATLVSDRGYLGEYASLDALLAAGAPRGSTARLTGFDRLYQCTGNDSADAHSWVWWATTSAYVTTSRRYIRLHSSYTQGDYFDITMLRYRGSNGLWYPTVAMTGDNTPSPLVASMDSVYGGQYPAWHAFDGSASSRASTYGDVSDHWITLDLGDGNAITPVAAAVTICNGRYPRDCAIEGSDTGAFAGEQLTYYSHAGVTSGWESGVERVFEW